METITSEIKITNIEVPERFHYDVSMDPHVQFYEPGFSEYLKHTKTRYHDCFRYFYGDTIIGQSLGYYGEYSDNEVQLLLKFCHPETVFYDIGSNIGYHSTGLATKSKQVHAFEPNNKNYKLCKMNTFHSLNVKCHNVACSDSNGVAKIQDWVLGNLGNHGELSLSEEGQDCTIVKLDDYVKEHNIEPPHIVKIDVEGHEWQVIQGMKNIIEDNLPVIFYEHLHGDGLVHVSDYLDSRGYSQFWFPVPNYNPKNFKRNTENIFGGGGVLNVLAVPFHMNFSSNLPKKIPGESWEQCVAKLPKV